MPLIKQHKVHQDGLLGVWRIEETYEDLYDKVELTEVEREHLDSFKNPSRKIEWLSVRVLLKTLLGRPGHIIYNDKRKPFLADGSFNISISHSRDLTSVLLSKNHRVGLDLEYMSHKIEKVEHKFINEKEQIENHEAGRRRNHLYIHWCAKEALYKICDKVDINFRKNLTILPFKPAHDGQIKGLVDNIRGHEEFDMHYFKIDDYVVVYCMKEWE